MEWEVLAGQRKFLDKKIENPSIDRNKRKTVNNLVLCCLSVGYVIYNCL
jgi:hypothetical protein